MRCGSARTLSIADRRVLQETKLTPQTSRSPNCGSNWSHRLGSHAYVRPPPSPAVSNSEVGVVHIYCVMPPADRIFDGVCGEYRIDVGPHACAPLQRVTVSNSPLISITNGGLSITVRTCRYVRTVYSRVVVYVLNNEYRYDVIPTRYVPQYYGTRSSGTTGTVLVLVVPR